MSKLKLITRLEIDINFNKKEDFFLGALAIDTKQNCFKKKKEKQISQINATKHAKLLIKIFDWIYIVKCQKIFFFWLGTITWLINKAKTYFLLRNYECFCIIN